MKRLILLFPVCLLLAGCGVATKMGELPDTADEAYFSSLPNYRDGKFVNQGEEPVVNMRRFSIFRMLRHLNSSDNGPTVELPQIKLTGKDFAEQPDEFSVIWLGHSSLIIELDHLRFAVDPVFGNAAPVPGVVKRYVPSPLPRHELPKLDFVIITHDHYDHLEYDTIQALRDTQTVFVTTLGVGARLRGWGIPAGRIIEMNWDEFIGFGGLKITALPARHFSGRTLDGRNKTLWASFVIEGNNRKIYLGGDGGYGTHFKEIGSKYGPFDLIFLEIDAWNENWSGNHLFPIEAVNAYHELKGKQLLPIHWGVFDLAHHPWDDSIRYLELLARRNQVNLLTPQMGQKVIPGVTATQAWW